MSTLLENLNKEQLEAVTHKDGPLLIVAGAGTGKTTVITRRIAYLIEQQLAKPEEILALTFTDKAAGEMEERVDQLLPLGTYDLWISTFHSFCERILKQHALDIGIPNDFKLLDEVQQWILAFRNFDKFNLDYYRPVGSPNKFIDALIHHFSKCKDEMITPEEYLDYAQKLKLNLDNPDALIPTAPDETTEIKRIEEIAGAYHVYQKLLLDNEYLDFGDLINYTMKLFQDRPNILKYYQSQFKFIMVDEFQDTNYAQYQLVKMLAGHSKEGNPNNLVVVGDDDQSIYKFRGASVSNILKLKEDFPQVKEITLIENYRSSQIILDLAYDFIQANNPNRLESKLGINKKLRSNIKTEGHIEVLEGNDLSEELDMVVKKIIEQKNADLQSTWNDFAILVRANSAAEEMLPRLEAVGITFNFVANRGLYRKRLIFDLISYMKLLDNYHESSALYRVLQWPEFVLAVQDMAAITHFGNKKAWSLYETLTNIRTIPGLREETYQKAERLMHFLHTHSEQATNHTAIEVFINIVNDLGVNDMLEGETLQNAQDRELLDQFYKRIELFEEQNEDKTLRNFITILNMEMMAGSEGPIKFDPELGPESLKILTIHSAKGLEFKYVFIINMVDQRFPTRAHRDPIEIPESLIKDILPEGDFHLQEERRLFYVALTRAKTHLYLSWAQDYGGAKTKKPSVFLVETKLVPSDRVSRATGKVVLTRTATSRDVVYKQLPTEFSFTDITVFKQCPLDYKYRFYLRLPMPGSASLSFGKTIHKVLQLFSQIYRARLNAPQQALFGGSQVEQPSLPDFSLLEQLYEENWIDEWYPNKRDKETFRTLGKQMLKSFYEEITQTKPNIKYIESSFRIPLGGFQFKGQVDRADKLDNGLAIIDYKTGEVPAKKNKDGIDQLRIYQWAAEEIWREPVEKLEYWYLKSNTKISIDLATPREIETLKTELLGDIDEIRHTVQYDLFNDLHRKSKQHRCNFEDLL
jgi:DNA helicase II / ATP-dependent DNA helicase PcrA